MEASSALAAANSFAVPTKKPKSQILIVHLGEIAKSLSRVVEDAKNVVMIGAKLQVNFYFLFG